MPSFPKSRRSGRGVGFWPIFAIGAVLFVLAAYVLLVLSNAIYLGDSAFYFFKHPRMWQRVWLTVWTASLATFFSMLVGVPVGYALSRFWFPSRTLLNTLIDIPVMVPPAAIGAFLFGFVRTFPVREITDLLGVELTHNWMGVIFVQFVVTASFCARLMKAGFDGVNPRFEQVSRSLGASLPRTFFKVTVPLAKNGIIASLIVVWARAVAEWEALMLFVGATERETDVLPFAIYLDWNGGMMGWVTSMCLVSIMMAISAMAAVRIIGGKSYVW